MFFVSSQAILKCPENTKSNNIFLISVSQMTNETPISAPVIVADAVKNATLEGLDFILQMEGIAKAQEMWTDVNKVYSTQVWWPPVAQAVREMFLKFKNEKEKRHGGRRCGRGGDVNVIVGSNVNGAKQWSNTEIDVRSGGNQIAKTINFNKGEQNAIYLS